MASTAVEMPVAAVSRFESEVKAAPVVSSTEVISSSTEASPSPSDSPKILPANSSSTSISSLDEKPLEKEPKLLDTYGNEFNLPDYTIKDIHNAIPKHCFERSGLHSLAYVARDFILCGINFVAWNNYIVPAMPNIYARGVAWAGYSIIQGLIMTGIWVLAHECGHQAFSPSKTLNDTVGWILHSSLLVPYFSWKISHGKHHKATGHLERDMVFVPKTRADYVRVMGRNIADLAEETPVATIIHSFAQQLFGWPAYLMSNVTGHNYHERQSEGRGKGKKNGYFGGVNHFNPTSPLFESKDAKLIFLSDIGLALAGAAIYFACQTWGAWNVFIWYGIPYLWVNHWLVAITYLQHTDPSLPHYDPTAWNYTRGAAATIDRDFGWVGVHLLHGIVEYHVAHHYISTIPFYHGAEATEAIKKVMGNHYRSDTKDGAWGFLKALYKSMRWCQWVEETEGAEGSGVYFFRNTNGLGVKPRDNDMKGAAAAEARKQKIIIGADE